MTPRTEIAPSDPLQIQRCGARNRDGTLCRTWPVRGTNRCRMHGGSAPQVIAAGQRRLARDAVRRRLDEVGIREVDNPLAELQHLTAEVVAWKDTLASHVAALQGDYRYADRAGEQLRAEVALYERALDRAGKFLELWARLGIDAMLAEMKVRVTEDQTKAMVRGLEAYRTAAGVDSEAHTAGLAAMAKALGR